MEIKKQETIEEVKRMKKWLSDEKKRLFNIVLQQNEIIEELEEQLKDVRETLELCGVDGMGTMYQQQGARMTLLNVDRYLDISPKNMKKFKELRNDMMDHAASFDGTMGRYIRFVMENAKMNASRAISPFDNTFAKKRNNHEDAPQDRGNSEKK